MNARPRRHGERGFTLIELIVSITLLAGMGVALWAAASMGIKALGNGGAGDRAAGAHDIAAFEQVVSADVTRAQCIGLGASTYGTCTHSVLLGAAGVCSGTTLLCVAWSQYTGTTLGCHVTAYSQASPGAPVVRKEYVMQAGAPVLQSGVFHVTTVVAGVSVALSASGLMPWSGTVWVSRVTLTVTDTSVPRNPPKATLVMRPLTSDPGVNAETLC